MIMPSFYIISHQVKNNVISLINICNKINVMENKYNVVGLWYVSPSCSTSQVWADLLWIRG